MPPPTSAGSAPAASAASTSGGSVAVEQHLPERDLRRRREPVGMRLEIRPELRLLRHEPARACVSQELHLLPQAPPDDRVVPVEPERQRLAIVDLLPNMVLDEPVQLRPRRRPAPDALELPGQTLLLRRGHVDDPPIRRRFAWSGEPVRAEDRQPDEEEVQQRLAEQAPEQRALRGHGKARLQKGKLRTLHRRHDLSPACRKVGRGRDVESAPQSS